MGKEGDRNSPHPIANLSRTYRNRSSNRSILFKTEITQTETHIQSGSQRQCCFSLQGLKSPLPAKLIPFIEFEQKQIIHICARAQTFERIENIELLKTREKLPPCDEGYAPHSFANLSHLKTEPNFNPHLTIDMLPILSPTLAV